LFPSFIIGGIDLHLRMQVGLESVYFLNEFTTTQPAPDSDKTAQENTEKEPPDKRGCQHFHEPA
jgi:hypothetical protein